MTHNKWHESFENEHLERVNSEATSRKSDVWNALEINKEKSNSMYWVVIALLLAALGLIGMIASQKNIKHREILFALNAKHSAEIAKIKQSLNAVSPDPKEIVIQEVKIRDTIVQKVMVEKILRDTIVLEITTEPQVIKVTKTDTIYIEKNNPMPIKASMKTVNKKPQSIQFNFNDKASILKRTKS